MKRIICAVLILFACSPAWAQLVVGSTPITGGFSQGVLFNNGGVLGNTPAGTPNCPLISGSPPQFGCTINGNNLAIIGNNAGFIVSNGAATGITSTSNGFLGGAMAIGTLNDAPVAFLQNNALAGSIQPNKLWTINNGLTVGGAGLTINPTPNSLSKGLNITQSGGGSLSCPPVGAGPPSAPIFFGCAYNSIFITGNNVNGTGGVVHGLSVQMYNNGTNVTNSNTAFFSNYTDGPPATVVSDRVALSGLSQIQTNQGGTASAPKGSVVTTNFYAIAGNDATHLFGINGMEMNVTARVGSSLYAKNGMSVVLQSDDAVQASSPYSIAYSLSSQVGAQNWKCGYCANNLNGQSPITATGTLFGTVGPGTAGALVDVSSYTAASWIFKANNFTVDHSGAVVSAASVKTGATTVSGLGVCGPTERGKRWFVTDAASMTFGSAAVGGGSFSGPVACNGAGWIIG